MQKVQLIAQLILSGLLIWRLCVPLFWKLFAAFERPIDQDYPEYEFGRDWPNGW